ncbi:protein decapping 5-like isoform X2 [Cucurbita maxima]|nr:protein decapping 5-like isoform X2 [Cucurbita maxima]
MHSVASGSLPDHTSHTAFGFPPSNFQGGLPPYQPGGNLGSWAASPPPPPSSDGSGLAMPLYWQGYYGPPNGLPQLHQQSIIRPPGLSIPSSMQQSMQYLDINASLPIGASKQPEAPSSLPPASNSSPNLTSTALPPTFSSALPMFPFVSISETIPSSVANKTNVATLPGSPVSVSLPVGPILSSFSTSSADVSSAIPPITNEPIAVSGPSLLYQSASQSTSSVVGISNSRTESSTPSLVTPGQLLQSAPTAVVPSQSSHTVHKDVEVVQSSSLKPSMPVTTETQPPILPLPVQSRPVQKSNGAHFQARHFYRGRERGRGSGKSSRPVTKFTEDFDFIAMNEKFNKDEVWGSLGKGSKSYLKDKDVDGTVSDEDDAREEDEGELSQAGIKPLYNKDDFFDSLSYNAMDNDPQNGRTRYSEQVKIDTETFGHFSRYRGGRGGQGPGRGGYFRGGYHGRGYGYNGRGWGRGRGRGRGRSSFNHS